MANVKRISLKVTETGLKRFQTIPTFQNLLYPTQIANLEVGENLIFVNHFAYSRLKDLSDEHIKLLN